MKAWVFVVCLITLACNELPVGGDELDQRGDLDPQFLNLSIFSTFTECKNVNTGGASNLVFGRNAEYESRVLLEFDFPDTTYTGLDEIKLILNIDADFENDTVPFSLHLMDETFSESEADWTHRNIDELWSTPGGDYNTDSIRYGVAHGDSIVLYFNYIELAEIQAAKAMIIIPRDTGFCYLGSREGGSGGKIILKKNETSIPAFVEADCHILTGVEPPLLEDWIGSGFVYRDFVRFNYDTLLDSTLAVYAELSFRCTEYFSYRDSLEIGVRQLLEPFSTFDTPTGPLIALKKIGVGDTVVTLDIVRHAQHIIEHPDSNFGFYIGISPEINDISRIKLVRGSHSLNIGYIQPPEPRNIE
ncbi:MAG: hypothetical protein JSW49_05805 [candidate division WOR-3 bacterium]|nr:MAG: hypothetical protein JSW49_05805 [candidate division WOR-3 bacterium]